MGIFTRSNNPHGDVVHDTSCEQGPQNGELVADELEELLVATEKLAARKCRSASNYVANFFKWSFIGLLTGLISGIVGSMFCASVAFATVWRLGHGDMLLLLPLGGVVTFALYRFCKMENGADTNMIIESIYSDRKPPFLLSFLIFISTTITHFVGGSAGREGAALQLGGCIGTQLGYIFRLNKQDLNIILLCGMSGIFASLFGTPVTATFLALEIGSVGIIYYPALFPCFITSLTAYGLTQYAGFAPLHFQLTHVPELSTISVLQTIALGAVTGAVSVIYCVSLHHPNKFLASICPNGYVRGALGGTAVLLMSLMVGSQVYNGIGLETITAAIAGSAEPQDFVLKILFTVVTISAGFKGGEIVPAFFIGATLGCSTAGLIGMDPGFGAALGLIGLFCGSVNCPVASVMLSIELFGAEGLLLFAMVCGVSYMLSGYYGLYSSQRIIYSKLDAGSVNMNVKE